MNSKDISIHIQNWKKDNDYPFSHSFFYDYLNGIVWEECFRGNWIEFVKCFGKEKIEYLVEKERIERERIEGEFDFYSHVKKGKTIYINKGIGTYKWKYNENVISLAIRKGCNFIDTSPSYGYSKVEKRLGEIINEKEYYSLLIGTKFQKNHMKLHSVIDSYERSKSRFPFNKIHFQLHWPNNKFKIEESLQAMNTIEKKENNVTLGLCNVSVDMIERYKKISPISSVQVELNYFRRDAIKCLLPFCRKEKIEVIAYRPFGNFFVTNEDKEKLNFFSKKENCSTPQLLLAWIKAKGACPIPMSNNIFHMEENIEAFDLILSNETLNELE